MDRHVSTQPYTPPKNWVDDKYLFAAYANLATHNVFHIVNVICKKLGKEGIPDDSGIFTNANAIFDPLKSAAEPEKVQKIIKALEYHFPFHEAMMKSYLWQIKTGPAPKQKADPEDYFGLFRVLFSYLVGMRNYIHNGKWFWGKICIFVA